MKLNRIRKNLECIGHVGLVFAICFSLMVPRTLTAKPYQPASSKDRQELLDNYMRTIYDQNPLLEDFMTAPFPEEFRTPSLSKDDTEILDVDPYFLRAQSWQQRDPVDQIQASNTKLQFELESEDDALTLYRSGWTSSIRIDVPMIPIFSGVEYTYFSLDSNSTLFGASDEELSPGVFFISNDELDDAYQNHSKGLRGMMQALPIYYLPLTGNAWSGPLKGFEWEEGDLITVYDAEGIPLPIELTDIRQFHKIFQLYTVIGQAMSLLAISEQAPNMLHSADILRSVYPASGSTAAFGTYISGVNLQSKSKSFAFIKNEDVASRSLLVSIVNQILSIKTAKADVTQFITPDALERVIFIGKIIGGTFAGSFLLKYTLYREHFKAKYESQAIEGSGSLREFLRRTRHNIGNELKGVFDVYSHGLTTVSSLIGLNILNTIELLGDRFAPGIMGPANKLGRKAFMKTLGWSRTNMRNLAVNHKTFWLGAIVMGSVDSALVVLQLIWVTPWIIHHLPNVLPSWALPNGMDGQNKAVVDPDSATSRFVTSEVIRNVVGYLRGGAMEYSADQRQLVQDLVAKAVDEQMRRDGVDPSSEKNAKLRNQRIEVEMEKFMALRGLPQKKDFLFDSFVVMDIIGNALGYEEPKVLGNRGQSKADVVAYIRNLQKKGWPLELITYLDDSKRDKELDWKVVSKHLKLDTYFTDLSENEKKLAWKAFNEHFVFKEGRRGLIVPTLNHAIDNLQKLSKLTDSEEGIVQSALEGMLKLRWRISGLWATTKTVIMPWQVVTNMQDMREARKAIIAFSSAGSPDDYLDLLPDSVKNLFPTRESLKIAAQVFNTASHEMVDGKTHFSDYLDIAIVKIETSPVSKGEDGEASIETTPVKTTASEVFAKADAFAKEREDSRLASEINNFDPKEVKSWYQLWQERRAHKRASKELMISGTNPKPSEEAYNKAYAKELAQMVGLKVDLSSEFVGKVIKEANERTEKYFKDEKHSTYLERLKTDEEKLRFKAEVYAGFVIDCYTEMSVLSDDHGLDPMSTEQPGRFQALRIWIDKKVRGSLTETKFQSEVATTVVQPSITSKPVKWLSGMIRMTEAMFNSGAHKTGFWNGVDRNIPMLSDARHNFLRSLKTMPFFLTIGYTTLYYIWQVKMDFEVFALFMLLSFSGVMMVEFNNRIMRHVGVKPMEGTWSKTKYAFVHSWLTFWSFIPVMLYADPLVTWSHETVRPFLREQIVKPISNSVDAVITNADKIVQTVTTTCERLLTAVF